MRVRVYKMYSRGLKRKRNIRNVFSRGGREERRRGARDRKRDREKERESVREGATEEGRQRYAATLVHETANLWDSDEPVCTAALREDSSEVRPEI